MLPLLLCFAAIAQSAYAQGSSVCNSAAFQAVPASPLGSSPLMIRTLVQGNTACLEFELSSSAPANTAWFAVGLARAKAMVNSPPSNVMLFQSDVGTPESYVLSAYSPSGVFKEPTQTSFTMVSTSTSPLKYSYERQLTAQSQYDVPIDVTQEMNFVWSFGKSWPISGHSPGSMGTASYSFAAGANRVGSNAGASTFTTPSTGYCDGKNCSAILGAIAFGAMLLCGFIFTVLAGKSKFTKTVLEKTLAAPPVKSTTNAPIPSFGTKVAQTFADLRVGELIVILIFLVAAIMIRVLSKVDSYRITSGKIALMVLMFLILPIAKVPLWSILFGSSFERIVKFHRWLGSLLVLVVIGHLVLVLQKVNATSTVQYNNAVPLWGFLALITFVLMALSAFVYVRRMFFEVFYFSHRILGILAFVFTILHSPARVGTALAVPLAFYVIGLIDQWRRSYLSSYQASVQANDVTGTTTILLQPSKKLVHYVESMNLCSYFWVRIPSVSSYEWHPFSAIVTRDGDSLGFCIRGMGNDNTFTRRLHAHAKTTQSLNLNLCGPFGKIGLDVTQYDTVLWMGGGVGVTPLLSAVNHRHRLASLKSHVADWHVLWSVRRPHELLMGETFMPLETTEMPTANQNDTKSSVSVTWHCYCSDQTADGSIERSQGDAIRYRGGIAVLDEYINSSRWVGRKVAVFACGPPTMTVAAQALARQCGFAFHKEVFSW